MSEKRDGVGTDGTIPGDPDGVAAGATPGEPSTFEPEEDPGRAGGTARPEAAEAQREESEDASSARKPDSPGREADSSGKKGDSPETEATSPEGTSDSLEREAASQPDAGDERTPGGIGAVDGGSGGNQDDITPHGI